MESERQQGAGDSGSPNSETGNSERMNEQEEKTKPTVLLRKKEANSLRKKEANRQNALRSTGPRTSEGKHVVRWNVLKHGLLAQKAVVPAGPGQENLDEFRFLLEQLRRDLQPHGAVEEILVEKIAVCYWRLRRLLHSEMGELQKGLASAVDEAASHQRILKMVGREMTEEEEDRWIETEQDCRRVPESEVVDKLLRYETKLERELYRALHQLERTQRQKRGEMVPPPVTVDFSG